MASHAESRFDYGMYDIKLTHILLDHSLKYKRIMWSRTGRSMGLTWRKEYLDLVMVPIGVLIMFAYHLFLIYRYLKHQHTTIFGYELHNKRAWVDRMTKVENLGKSQAISVISNQLTAATSLSSISLVLCSLIGAWLGSSSIFSSSKLIYGDTSPSTMAIKYVALLSCFIVAFGYFVQTARCFVLANFLISMPDCDIPGKCVENEVIIGSQSWSVGMRALHFATVFLMWIFGPIPMLISSLILVAVLHRLDTNTTPLHHYQPPRIHHFRKKNDQESLSDIPP